MKHRKRHGHQDHPRVCGEKFWKLIPSAPRFGSPPRMRGKVGVDKKNEAKPWITPAYAGKSIKENDEAHRFWDHPRVCGEKFVLQVQICPLRRITPAYAGKSLKNDRQCSSGWDHPRVCGEKSAYHPLQAFHAGSPPRMRGKVYSFQSSPFRSWITPAYAGKRPQASMRPLRSGGSPPRMRGKARLKENHKWSQRITPAYAGKRNKTEYNFKQRQDHPRVCGEKLVNIVAGFRRTGSPPRMRGKD